LLKYNLTQSRKEKIGKIIEKVQAAMILQITFENPCALASWRLCVKKNLF